MYVSVFSYTQVVISVVLPGYRRFRLFIHSWLVIYVTTYVILSREGYEKSLADDLFQYNVSCLVFSRLHDYIYDEVLKCVLLLTVIESDDKNISDNIIMWS